MHPSWTENACDEAAAGGESSVIAKWLPRNTAVVIGSGLGRDAASLAAASHALADGDRIALEPQNIYAISSIILVFYQRSAWDCLW